MYRYQLNVQRRDKKKKKDYGMCIAIKGVDMAHQNIQTQFDE